MREADDAIRRNWAQLAESEKNVFLHQMANALIETKPGTGVRWQDIVLMELGWDECIQNIPLSRKSAMEDILSRAMGSRS